MTPPPPVICERLFKQVLCGETKPLRVAWIQPVPSENDWACDYVIEWPGRPWRSRRIFGVDSAQSLLLAMKTVAGELYCAEPQVFWWEPDDVLGLPIAEDFSDLEAARTKGR